MNGVVTFMAFRRPPLGPVRLFEAAGRLLSFKAAADELNLTPSAISHGVQTLEEWLGAELFVRTQRSLALTQAGERFMRPVRQAFATLSVATERLPGRRAAGLLSVSVPITFGSRWLLPRLGRFSERYPDIVVAIHTDYRQQDHPVTGTDLGIRLAASPRAGGTWLRLVRETFVPVCAPALLARFDGSPRGELLLRAPLIHVTTVAEDWEWWFAQSGTELRGGKRLKFDTIRLATDAASQGLGIALGRKPFVDDEIASGCASAPVTDPATPRAAPPLPSRSTTPRLA
jgi:LysR family transcriptional regulator, glycine cleavage system transcriptional activator